MAASVEDLFNWIYEDDGTAALNRLKSVVANVVFQPVTPQLPEAPDTDRSGMASSFEKVLNAARTAAAAIPRTPELPDGVAGRSEPPPAAPKPPAKPTSAPTTAKPEPTTPYKGGAPADAVAYANKYGNEYGVDPKLLLAIAKHETAFGTLGLGRKGLDLGYGAFDSGASYKWAGRENQYRYAAMSLAKHGVHSISDIQAGRAAYWATDPRWEVGIVRAYQSL